MSDNVAGVATFILTVHVKIQLTSRPVQLAASPLKHVRATFVVWCVLVLKSICKANEWEIVHVSLTDWMLLIL